MSGFFTTADPGPYGDKYTGTKPPTFGERATSFLTMRNGGRMMGEWKAKNEDLIKKKAVGDIELEQAAKSNKQQIDQLVERLKAAGMDNPEVMAAMGIATKVQAEIAKNKAEAAVAGRTGAKATGATPRAEEEGAAEVDAAIEGSEAKAAESGEKKADVGARKAAGVGDTTAQWQAAEAKKNAKVANLAQTVAQGALNVEEQFQQDPEYAKTVGDVVGARKLGAATDYNVSLGTNRAQTPEATQAAVKESMTPKPMVIPDGAMLVPHGQWSTAETNIVNPRDLTPPRAASGYTNVLNDAGRIVSHIPLPPPGTAQELPPTTATNGFMIPRQQRRLGMTR
jgi:hypothetical protein